MFCSEIDDDDDDTGVFFFFNDLLFGIKHCMEFRVLVCLCPFYYNDGRFFDVTYYVLKLFRFRS